MAHGTAVIVGVGPGLGLELARTFANAGHPVRDKGKLDAFATELQERLRVIVALAREVADSAAAGGRCVTRPIDEHSHPGNCQYLLLLAPRSNVDCPVGGTVRSPRPVAVTEPDAGFGIHQRRIRHLPRQGGLA
jgi:NAD(P)-dependent dehydrogenase (short-subunit alcohol dehydrogenase family)